MTSPSISPLPPTQGEKLKPCPNPWCASHQREQTRDAYAPYVKLFTGGYSRVMCAVCPQIGPADDDADKAIAAWNARTVSTPVQGEVERIEAECARLLACYLRREIGVLMHQAEHWAENGKPLAVHHRLMKADNYFQILVLMERDTTKGWKPPFDEVRARLERPDIYAPGAYPPSKDLYRYRDPAFVVEALASLTPSAASTILPASGEWSPSAAVQTAPVVARECGYNHPVGTRCPACADWPYKKGGAAAYTAALSAPRPVEAPSIPSGMKPWHGGDAAPADWDGGPVLFRNGTVQSGALSSWSHPWDAGVAGESAVAGSTNPFDITAYTPRPVEEAAQTGEDGDGGEAITAAAKRMVAVQGMDWAELDGSDIGYWESLAAVALPSLSEKGGK